MGGVNTCCVGRCLTTNEAPENHLKQHPSSQQSSRRGLVFFKNSMNGSAKRHRRHLSATFMQFDSCLSLDDKTLPMCMTQLSGAQSCNSLDYGRININTAVEEELMTLPGINRERARAVVAYRARLGGFRQAQDLVLVPGIGGDRLAVLLPEITVGSGNGANHTINLQRCSSVSTGMSTSFAEPVLAPVVINSANVFQLMKVPGLSQKQAEAIVAFRERHAKFTSLDELLLIKGIDQRVLQALQPYLVLTKKELLTMKSATNKEKSCNVDVLGRLGQLFSNSQLQLLCDLSSLAFAQDERSTSQLRLPPVFTNGALRVLYWNLERLTKAKASNPGVREVFCRTLLEHRLDLIVLNDVIDPEAVHLLLSELNAPKLPLVQRWPANLRGHWHCVVSSSANPCQVNNAKHIAFLWNSEIGDSAGNAASSSQLEMRWTASLTKCEPSFVGSFTHMSPGVAATSTELMVILVNATVSSATFSMLEILHQLYAWSIDSTQALLLMLDDFFSVPDDHHSFQELRSSGFTRILCNDTCIDIWVNSRAAQLFAQHESFGVIEEGLTHPLIPADDFQWNGRITKHSPTWCQLQSPTNQIGC